MRIFLIDIGKGTQDILYGNESKNIENWIKAILPSRSTILFNRIKNIKENLRIDGYPMGGGPVKLAIYEHIRKGYKVEITREAAKTIKDDLELVREKGVNIKEYVNNPNIKFGDLDFNMFETLLSLAGERFKPDVFAVACQDHGFIKGESDRITRFNYFSKKLKETDIPYDFFIKDRTGFFSRFDAILKQISERELKGFVMDSKMASICGILTYAEENSIKEFVGIDIGNAHTLAVSIRNGRICGLFEHHTRYLNPEKLMNLVKKLYTAQLTFEEIFNDEGHGAIVIEGINPEKILIAGPNRGMFKKFGDYAYPGGDVMITGCIGLLHTFKKSVEKVL